jgi:hypothetical protein
MTYRPDLPDQTARRSISIDALYSLLQETSEDKTAGKTASATG